MRGDVNQSGDYEIEDASMALEEYVQAAADPNAEGSLTLDDEEYAAADVDYDGAITITDAAYILQAYVDTASNAEVDFEAYTGIETKPAWSEVTAEEETTEEETEAETEETTTTTEETTTTTTTMSPLQLEEVGYDVITSQTEEDEATDVTDTDGEENAYEYMCDDVYRGQRLGLCASGQLCGVYRNGDRFTRRRSRGAKHHRCDCGEL